jgi:hypothetical protein
MDKSFNDDELADIMNEIENLEKEFADDAATPEAELSSEETHTEPTVLRALVNKNEEETVLKTNYNEKAAPMSKSTSSSHHSSLSFKVEGEMTLNLGFEVNGHSICMSISEEGLNIEMESGAKFTLPMHDKGMVKKVA